MSNQNRFLLPHQPSPSTAASQRGEGCSAAALALLQQMNEYQVDIDFDSYWEEEARNPNRNRIRIGRQYQATVPPLLKQGESDERKLEELETLSFCPKRSARVTNAELDHYFTVAKSLNLFASLVETRSLLGRDVTIADLNRIRQKEGLSLASVIQPSRQATTSSGGLNVQPPPPSQATNLTSASSAGEQPQSSQQDGNKPTSSSYSLSSPRDSQAQDNVVFNQPLMKALSHFISLHHPCHHDNDCKKLLKDIPLEDDSGPTVSITAGNLRGSPSKENKAQPPSRSRSKNATKADGSERDSATGDHKDHPSGDLINSKQPLQSTYNDWTREEVELFSKAIEVCGKNFGSIKKEFLPSKSVRSIVEYYYIGSRDIPESRKKFNQNAESSDGCSSPEKTNANNNNNGGNGNGGGDNLQLSGRNASSANFNNLSTHRQQNTDRSSAPGCNSTNGNNDKTLTDSNYSEKQDQNHSENKIYGCPKLGKIDIDNSATNYKSTNLDPRMSVYNFDEEETAPVRLDCPRPGAEVRPLKAKPIIPTNPGEGEASNSNVGSLKFFMDGQLVLKLNACQEPQERGEKCHWVQSGDRLPVPGKQKRYTKRSASDRTIPEFGLNGSQSNSVRSSNHDDDSKNDDLISADEDSKESGQSFANTSVSSRPNSFSASPTPKRARPKAESSISPNQNFNQQVHPIPQPQQPFTPQIDYSRLAVNNRMKSRTDSNNGHNNLTSPLVSQAMPWLQANSFAMAAALLGGLPFPSPTGSFVGEQMPVSSASSLNIATKPMDLSVEHTSPKSIQAPKQSRSRSKQKN